MSGAAVTEVKKSYAVTPAPAVITLAGKVAIVTGAGRGIGAAIATRLARDGAKVIVNYHSDKKSADEVVAVITKSGGHATAVQADASTSAGVDKIFSETKRIYSKVDILVANAGIWLGGSIATTAEAEFDRVFAINVKGVFLALKAAANQLENNGRIVTIGTILHRGSVFPGVGPYSATKAAVLSLTNAAAQELAAKGITANTVSPGPVETDLLTGHGTQDVSHYAKVSPFNRLGSVGDLGDAVSLVVSESARWISGQHIIVSGAGRD